MGEESARSAGSEATAAGAGGAAPGKFLTASYAKPIGYQYRRFKTVDETQVVMSNILRVQGAQPPENF